ncbi:efflux RND transporter periplasmic adaptor subunit [Engelhardtia mirabilis]|uniref:Multidrug resistance protein MdtA n=1 Tax=Engelhardtia mirabilis TaxID=2528011 RepID=A0A518BNL5_9BACT|nr:Multidrug resistance protein MdtA precursor [Planctomycetes bacterium Pla133]QDV02872.1 Multidrug resistance protein MdtA precursor [Planctomycetes bacterium Pla86]
MANRLLPALLVAGVAALASFPTTASRIEDPGYPCVLLPSAQVRLSPAADGVLAEILVERGDSVRAGDLVARLESGVEAAELALARTRADQDRGVELARVRVDELERKVARLAPLAEQRIASAEVFDGAQVELATARLQLEQAAVEADIAGLEAQRAQARLAQRELRSPVDGIVTELHLEVGEFSSRSGEVALVELAAIDPLIADVRVPLTLFDDVRVGDVVTARVDLDGGLEVEARVTAVDRVADAASGTIRVRIELPNADDALPAGAPARVLFSSLD